MGVVCGRGFGPGTAQHRHHRPGRPRALRREHARRRHRDPAHRQHRARRRPAVALLLGACLLADPHRPHDRPVSDPCRAHAFGRGAVAGLRARYERSPDAGGARGRRLRTPRDLRQVAPRTFQAPVASASARLHGVRGARLRGRLLHPRAVGRARLEPRLRAAGRGRLCHGPAGRPGRQLHRRARGRRGAVLPVRAVRRAAYAHPGEGRGPAPLRSAVGHRAAAELGGSHRTQPADAARGTHGPAAHPRGHGPRAGRRHRTHSRRPRYARHRRRHAAALLQRQRRLRGDRRQRSVPRLQGDRVRGRHTRRGRGPLAGREPCRRP